MPTEPQLEPYYLPRTGSTGSVSTPRSPPPAPWFAEAQHVGPPSALLIRALQWCGAAAGSRAGPDHRRGDRPGPGGRGAGARRAGPARPGRRAAVRRVGGRRAGGAAGPGLADRRRYPARGRRRRRARATRAGDGHRAARTAGRLAARVHRLDGMALAGRMAGRARAGHRLGPARVPLVAGEEASALQRLALVADSGNGVAAPLDIRGMDVREHRDHGAPAPPAGGRVDRGGCENGGRADRARHGLPAVLHDEARAHRHAPRRA